MNNLKCYAILNIPDGYFDYMGYFPKYKKEFFDISSTGFSTDNEEGLISYISNVLKVDTFEIHWTIFEPDHFKELYNLEEYEYI